MAGDVQFTVEAIDQASKTLNNITGGFKDLGTSLLAPIAGMVSFTAAIKLAQEAMSQAADEESSLVSLNATIASMGLSSKVSGANIRIMTEAMQAANGVFAHDDLERAAQSFLRIESFDPSSLKGALGVVQDFAAGTGQSAATAAQQIATALETGQTRSLHFSAALRTQIQDMIKAGDSGGALALIMDTLNEKFGGQAAAQLDTYNGKIEVLKNNWHELLATAGGEGLPAGKGVVSTLNSIVTAYDQLLQIEYFFDNKILVGAAKGMLEYYKMVGITVDSMKELGRATEDLIPVTEREANTTKELTESIDKEAYSAAYLKDQLEEARKQIIDRTAWEQSYMGAKSWAEVTKLQIDWIGQELQNLSDQGALVWEGYLAATGQISEAALTEFVKIQEAYQTMKKMLEMGVSVKIIVQWLVEKMGGPPAPQINENAPGYHYDPESGQWVPDTSRGGAFQGWAMVGDSPGGGKTPYTEWVYAPGGATVFNQAQMSGKSAPPMASGGIIPPTSETDLSDATIRKLADALMMSILAQ
jgi:hypothetical protein